MALASQRLIVPISAEDKRMVKAKAARLGKLSAAELVRRAVVAYDPEDEAVEDEVRALLTAFPGLHAETMAQLDRTDAALDRCLARMDQQIVRDPAA